MDTVLGVMLVGGVVLVLGFGAVTLLFGHSAVDGALVAAGTLNALADRARG